MGQETTHALFSIVFTIHQSPKPVCYHFLVVEKDQHELRYRIKNTGSFGYLCITSEASLLRPTVNGMANGTHNK